MHAIPNFDCYSINIAFNTNQIKQIIEFECLRGRFSFGHFRLSRFDELIESISGFTAIVQRGHALISRDKWSKILQAE